MRKAALSSSRFPLAATPVGWKNIGRSGISNEVPFRKTTSDSLGATLMLGAAACQITEVTKRNASDTKKHNHARLRTARVARIGFAFLRSNSENMAETKGGRKIPRRRNTSGAPSPYLLPLRMERRPYISPAKQIKVNKLPTVTNFFAWLLYINRFGSKTCNVATGDVKVEESLVLALPKESAPSVLCLADLCEDGCNKL
mmetsp:Transcript_70130/g.154652  ORF Transcript_70130/g.154652 Transcript_70130/m.154652 type:complete len:200 (+) Transcript_70130:806-1405(+)